VATTLPVPGSATTALPLAQALIRCPRSPARGRSALRSRSAQSCA
jgi:hypothetical protein